MALGILAFVAALLVSVMLHEGGHFLTARHFGMKASRFFVGFGPTLWSFRRGETEYGVKAIPAGGFVKIEGMTPLEELQPGDENRAFWKFPARQRAVVLSAGSFMHFVLAALLVYGIVLAAGVAESDPPVVGTVTKCIPAADGASCSSPGAKPAPAAGVLASGDRITSVDGQSVSNWTQAVKLIRGAEDRPVSLTVRRDGRLTTVTLRPVVVSRPSLTDPTKSVRVGAIGVIQGFGYRHFGPIAAIGQTGQQLRQMLTNTYTVLTKKVKTIGRVYSKDRDPEGFVGAIGAGRISGDILALPKISFGQRVAAFLGLVAGINLFVGIFNLFPLLPLDGGHLAIAGFEQARYRVRRWLGYRGELRRVDPNKLLPITYAFVVLLVGLTIYIAGADIVNPIRLSQ